MDTTTEYEVNGRLDDSNCDNNDPCNSTIIYPPLPEYPISPWKYEMRREMQEICPNVYFGSYASATKKKLDELLCIGFTHIVCIRHMLERRVIKPNFPEYFIYKVVEMNENSFESIIPRCLTVCEFVTESLDQGGKVLIHGNSGAGSSATVIIAFVMFRFGISPKEAHQFVQQRRFCIRPMDHFLDQLKEFEPIFQARQLKLLWNRMNGYSMGGLKRKVDDALQSDENGQGKEAVGLKRILEDDGYSEQDVDIFQDQEGQGISYVGDNMNNNDESMDM